MVEDKQISPSFMTKTTVFSLIFVLIALNFFLWGRELNACGDGVTIDHNIWGTFGDFIGGILGTALTLLSAFMMYWTFQSQRILTRNSDAIQQQIAKSSQESQERIAKDANDVQLKLTKLSIEQAELQRFNDLFFNLLDNYKSLSKELTDIISCECQECNLNYFDEAMTSLFQNFNPAPQYGKSVEKATKRYTKFYLKNASLISPIFRILYRIIELIDTAKISDREKQRYAKIVRAQLRESELFILRYNCMTPYGENFIEYINRYHLLKHLPIMSLLEFKKFRSIMNNDENIYLILNVLFHKIWRIIYHVTIGKEDRQEVSYIVERTKRYTFSIDLTSKNQTSLNLYIYIHNRNTVAILKPLSHLGYSDIELFLKYFLQEMYRYSNFQKYNDQENCKLKFYSNIEFKDGLVSISATAKSNMPLRLSHPFMDDKYGI